MVMVSPQGTGFSTPVSGSGSGLGLLRAGVSHPHSVNTTWGIHPEGLPTIMARSSLGFRISVLHIPWGGHRLQQLIHPSTIARCRKYSGSLSTTVLNEAHFGFIILFFFPWSCTIIFCNHLRFFVLFSVLLCMNLLTSSRCPGVVCSNYSSSSPACSPCLGSCSGKDFPFSLASLLPLLPCLFRCLLAVAVKSAVP